MSQMSKDEATARMEAWWRFQEAAVAAIYKEPILVELLSENQELKARIDDGTASIDEILVALVPVVQGAASVMFDGK